MADQKKAGKLLKQIEEEFETFKENAEQFVDNGNAAAARRARKATSNMAKMGKEFRKVSV